MLLALVRLVQLVQQALTLHGQLPHGLPGSGAAAAASLVLIAELLLLR